MAVVRILVDGYSLLHKWPAIAPGKPRHSEFARAELIHRVTQYFDSCGTPITVVFDGQGTALDLGPFPSTPEVEIIYSQTGRTADQLIERVVSRMKPYGEVMVVTDDFAERETVQSAGGMVCSCANFIQMVEEALSELEHGVTQYNQREQLKFRSH